MRDLLLCNLLPQRDGGVPSLLSNPTCSSAERALCLPGFDPRVDEGLDCFLALVRVPMLDAWPASVPAPAVLPSRRRRAAEGRAHSHTHEYE